MALVWHHLIGCQKWMRSQFPMSYAQGSTERDPGWKIIYGIQRQGVQCSNLKELKSKRFDKAILPYIGEYDKICTNGQWIVKAWMNWDFLHTPSGGKKEGFNPYHWFGLGSLCYISFFVRHAGHFRMGDETMTCVRQSWGGDELLLGPISSRISHPILGSSQDRDDNCLPESVLRIDQFGFTIICRKLG